MKTVYLMINFFVLFEYFGKCSGATRIHTSSEELNLIDYPDENEYIDGSEYMDDEGKIVRKSKYDWLPCPGQQFLSPGITNSISAFPNDCHMFYQCHHRGNNKFSRYVSRCPPKYFFPTRGKNCEMEGALCQVIIHRPITTTRRTTRRTTTTRKTTTTTTTTTSKPTTTITTTKPTTTTTTTTENPTTVSTDIESPTKTSPIENLATPTAATERITTTTRRFRRTCPPRRGRTRLLANSINCQPTRTTTRRVRRYAVGAIPTSLRD